MPTMLRKLKLRRVSLVDTPANQAAQVVLFKSAEGQPAADNAEVGIGEHAEKMQPTSAEVNVDEFAGKCKKCETPFRKGDAKCSKCGASLEDIEKVAEGRPKEEDQMDEKLKADLDAALAQVKAQQEEIEALKKRLETPEEIEKRKLESLPESVRKQLVEQAEEIAKMRSEKSEAEHIEKARKEMPNVPGKTEDLGRFLKRAKDSMKSEDFEALTTILKAASAQIEKGGLFREVGKSGDEQEGEETPFAKSMRLANEIVTKNAGMDPQTALSQVFREHPELYAAYARSVSVGANADRD